MFTRKLHTNITKIFTIFLDYLDYYNIYDSNVANSKHVYLFDGILKKGTKLNWNLFMVSKIFHLEKSAKICWFRRTNIHVAISWSFNNRFLHKNVWHSKRSYVGLGESSTVLTLTFMCT